MSTYRNARRDTAIADDHLANHLPCNRCGTSTPREDLERLGARCRSCFEAFQAEANPSWWPNRPLTQSERAAVIRKARQGLAQMGQSQRDPRQWAHDLKAREDAGERLSPVQKQAWRDALRAHLTAEAA